MTTERLFDRLPGMHGPERFRQRSLDDLGAPLVDTTFVVIDLETTGGSPATDAITELGAVKVRGGEVLGTFRTLVDPGRSIPPTIIVLTGITQSMVARAPRIDAVLPSLLEFIGDGVIVGHNVRFDVGFLQAALERDGHDPLTAPTVDTVALARRLVRDEVPDCRLGTLAEHLRLAHRPSHRALDDALATADLLHLLLERAGSLGVTGLDDLIDLPRMAGHPQADKLRLTRRLPRRPGVYLFRDRAGVVLYVGKATDLRSRVRSYFSTDDRRKVGALLQATTRIDHKVCPSTLEASVLEARLIRVLEPRYNSHGTRWRRYPYLRLTTRSPVPKLTVARIVGDDGVHFGPLRSTRQARAVADAVAGLTDPQQIIDGLTRRPGLIVEPLRERMEALGRAERFEEAAAARDHLSAVVDALERQRRIQRVLACERLMVEVDSGELAELRRGILWQMWPVDRDGRLTTAARPVEMRPTELPPSSGPVRRELADELACVASWLDRHADRIRLLDADGTFASSLPRLPDLRPRRRAAVPR